MSSDLARLPSFSRREDRSFRDRDEDNYRHRRRYYDDSPPRRESFRDRTSSRDRFANDDDGHDTRPNPPRQPRRDSEISYASRNTSSRIVPDDSRSAPPPSTTSTTGATAADSAAPTRRQEDTPTARDVKAITRYITERTYWYLQRVPIEHRIQKLKADQHRAQQADVPSAIDMLQNQIRADEVAMTKITQRYKESDKNLALSADEFSQNMQALVDSAVSAAVKKFKTQATTESTSSTVDIQEQLAAFKASMVSDSDRKMKEQILAIKEDLAQKSKQEMSVLQKSYDDKLDSLRSQTEAQVSDLERRFEVEKEAAQQEHDDKLNSLRLETENRVSDLERQAEVDKEAAQQQHEADISAMRRDIANERKIRHLAEQEGNTLTQKLKGLIDINNNKLLATYAHRYNSNEQVESAWKQVSEDIALRLSKLEETAALMLAQRPPSPQLETPINSPVEEEGGFETVQKGIEAVAKVRNNLHSQFRLGSRPSESAADGSLTQHVAGEVEERVKTYLKDVSTNFGQFIDSERAARGVLSARVDELLQKVANIDFQQMSQDVQDAIEAVAELEKNQRRATAAIGAHGNDVDNLQHRIKAVCEEHNLKNQAVLMQLDSLNNWQNNFSTKSLYLQIVDFIHQTQPKGVNKQLKALDVRLESLESSMGGDTKRRKLVQNGDVSIRNERAAAYADRVSV